MAGDTLGLMDHLRWRTAHVVGMSMGGARTETLERCNRPGILAATRRSASGRLPERRIYLTQQGMRVPVRVCSHILRWSLTHLVMDCTYCSPARGQCPRHDRHEACSGGAGAGAVADGPELDRVRAPHGVVHAVVAAARPQGTCAPLKAVQSRSDVSVDICFIHEFTLVTEYNVCCSAVCPSWEAVCCLLRCLPGWCIIRH